MPQQVNPQEMLRMCPPQLNEEGEPMSCKHCGNQLNPIANRNFDATTPGYCNKICDKAQEKKEAQYGN